MVKSYLVVLIALLLSDATLHILCTSNTKEMVAIAIEGGNQHKFYRSDQGHCLVVEEHLDYQELGANYPTPHGQ